jgi:hypothetical protein
LTANAGVDGPKKKNFTAASAQKETAKAKSNPRKRGSQSCFSLEVGKVRFHMPEKIRGVNAFGD